MELVIPRISRSNHRNRKFCWLTFSFVDFDSDVGVMVHPGQLPPPPTFAAPTVVWFPSRSCFCSQFQMVLSFQQIEICSKKIMGNFWSCHFFAGWKVCLRSKVFWKKEVTWIWVSFGKVRNRWVFKWWKKHIPWIQHQGHVAKGTVEMEVWLRLVDTREGFPL